MMSSYQAIHGVKDEPQISARVTRTHVRQRWLSALGRSRFRIAAIFILTAGVIIGVARWWPGYRRSYFRAPLDQSLQLAANFGELRENHFHMGLDIRTQGREGLPVYAAADGYISHLSIQPDGLGHAVFIRHANGLTTVYGHLSRLADPLEQFVSAAEYAQRRWAVELDAEPGRFPVKKGQQIGYSGNTGSSLAPHLHFEVRDSRTGRNMNPLLHGFAIGDEIAPAINGLYWYDRRYSTYMVRARKIAISGRDGQYHCTGDIVRLNSPVVSLGINSTDRNSGSSHISGIYSADLWVDDTLLLSFRLESLLPEDTRYINACIDYTKWFRSGIYVQHLSVLPGNHAPIFSPSGGDGIIHLPDTRVHQVRISVSDVNGNHAMLELNVQYTGDPVSAAAGDIRDTEKGGLAQPGHETSLEGPHGRVHFSSRAFYDAVSIRWQEIPGSDPNSASPIISLHDPSVPVHDAYSIYIRTTIGRNEALRRRIVMQLVSGDSQCLVKGRWTGDEMTGTFNRLGTLRLLVDTVAPAVRTDGWEDGQTMSSDADALKISAADNLGAIAGFTGEIDGHWVPFAQKGNSYTYHFDANCPAGAHRLLVIASDVAGNQTKRAFHFTR